MWHVMTYQELSSACRGLQLTGPSRIPMLGEAAFVAGLAIGALYGLNEVTRC
jgi:hypothetical protein